MENKDLFEDVKIDVGMRLLLGLDVVCFEGVCLRQKTMKEIAEIGFLDYNRLTNIFNIDEELLKTHELQNGDVLTDFDFIILSSVNNKDFRNIVELSFYFFFGSKINFYKNFIVIDDKVFINKEKFDLLKKYIHLSQCITPIQDVKKKDVKVTEYLERVAKLKKELNIKDDTDDNVGINEIISSVVCRSQNISYGDISNMTMYQLLDCFKRLGKIDNYFVNIDSAIHGANQEDKLKHYSQGGN